MNNYLPPAPVAVLQRLIQFDTTNPPGNEAECSAYIAGLLSEAGIASQVFAHYPPRPNLLARIPGDGRAAPLLLYGHLDVVTTENQQWRYPPFEGRLVDGYVWGRGALDMKGGVAMLLSAALKARAEGIRLPGDVILAFVSDEEAEGTAGAGWLVENHPQLFAGVHYALGEFGGFTMNISGQRFYPIQTAEKQLCPIRATLRGPAGHASMPVRGGAMARLSRMLDRMERRNPPVHVTPVARQMIEAIGSGLGGLTGMLLRQLLNPALADTLLARMGENGRVFYPLLHNTASPTILSGSSKLNVIPGAITVDLDGRLLPGFGPQDMLAELRQLLGDEVELEAGKFEPGPAAADMGLFDTLAGILRQADPGGQPMPFLLSGVTDGRYFAHLGIQSYGFTPMRLPADFNFSGTIHAADERVPAEAIDFGTQAIFQALQRFGEAPQPKA